MNYIVRPKFFSALCQLYLSQLCTWNSYFNLLISVFHTILSTDNWFYEISEIIKLWVSLILVPLKLYRCINYRQCQFWNRIYRPTSVYSPTITLSCVRLLIFKLLRKLFYLHSFTLCPIKIVIFIFIKNRVIFLATHKIIYVTGL